MNCFVTGATGFIGTHVVERLVDRGDEVTALTRDEANATHLPGTVEVVEGDVADAEVVREAMAGVDGVFHLAAWYDMGPGPWNEERARRINVEGTRTVLEQMDELDVPRGVHASSVVVNGDTGGEAVDESYRYDGPFDTVYERTKWEAHYEVAKPMMADGLPLVAVMPGVVYGPGAHGAFRNKVLVPYLTGDLPLICRDTGLALEHVEDTARSIVSAMDHGDPGEEYLVCGHNRTLVELLALAEEITGVSPPRAVPPGPVDLLARIGSLLEPQVRPPEGYESEAVRALAGNTYYGDNTRAKRELGIEHRPLETGLREYFEWELDQQGMAGEAT